MKNYILAFKIVVCTLLGVSMLGSCTDNSYLVDGGKSNPYFNGTVWDYLNSRPDYFKKLVNVIEYSGMRSTFQDSSITFFAPTDWSINRSMQELNEYWYNRRGKDSVNNIKQVKPEIWKEFLSLYIVKDKYLLKDIPQIDTTALAAYGGQAYITYNGRPMNIGVVYGDAGGVKYAGYRQLLYSYIYDFTENDMNNAYVATSDIQPTNGVVHVIRFNDHTFGFNPKDFINKAVAAGIASSSEE